MDPNNPNPPADNPDIIKVGFTPTQVHNQSEEEILLERQRALEAQVTGTPPETPPATPPVATPPTPPATPPAAAPETPPAPAAPALDVEELKTKLGAELKEQISQDVADKVIKAIAPQKDETLQPPWVKENRNPTYQEAIDWAATQGLEKATPDLVNKVTEKVIENLNQEVTNEQKVEADKKAADESQQKAFEQSWNLEFEQLEATGKLPKANLEDNRMDEKGMYLDPGRKARQEVFSAMANNIKQVQGENKRQVTNADYSPIATFYSHYKPSTEQPAGADAPVYGANKTGSPSTGLGFTAQEVHNTKVEDLLAELHGTRGTI